MKQKIRMQMTALLLCGLLAAGGCGPAEKTGADQAGGNPAAGQESDNSALETAGIFEEGAGGSAAAEKTAEDSEVTQMVTIKADAQGNPKSAVIKRSDDDMEEKVSETELAALPFGVSVRYFLNGKEVTADEIAGASGPVRIRFDYDNHSKVSETVDGNEISTMVPYAFLSMVILPEDRFSDIEVKNGGVTSVSDNQVAYGYALPGLKEALAAEQLEDALRDLDDDVEIEDEEIPSYVEVDAVAEDFKLEFTATVVTGGLFAGIEDKTFDSLDDLTDELNEIADAGDDMQEGTDKLAEGADAFRDGLSKYVSGASQLAEGASKLSEGVSLLQENGSSLTEGASQLADGLNELDKSVRSLSAESTAAGEMPDLSSMIQIDGESIANEAVSKAIAAAAEQLAGNETLTDEEKAAIANAAGAAAGAAAAAGAGESVGTQLQSAFEQIGSAVSDAGSDASEQMEQLQNGVAALASGAGSLLAGIRTYTGGVDQLAEGAGQLSGGASAFSSSGTQLLSGYDKLQSGIRELADGIREMNEDSMQKAGNLADHELSDTIRRLNALRMADEGHTALGVYDGKKDSGKVRYLIETEEIKK